VTPDQVKDTTGDVLRAVQETGQEPPNSKDLKKRKLVSAAVTKDYAVAKGASFAAERKKAATDITEEVQLLNIP